eukprot:Trichotokara_eunicae@DN6467_c0_g1_i1.p1
MCPGHPASIAQQMSATSGGRHLSFVSAIAGATDLRTPKPKSYGVGLIAFLQFHFLCDGTSSGLVQAGDSDLAGSAVCLCHSDKIDFGYVCSSCLAIYCGRFDRPICEQCGMRFKFEKRSSQ